MSGKPGSASASLCDLETFERLAFGFSCAVSGAEAGTAFFGQPGFLFAGCVSSLRGVSGFGRDDINNLGETDSRSRREVEGERFGL